MISKMPHDAHLEAHIILGFINNNQIRNMKSWAGTIAEEDFFTITGRKAMAGVRACLNRNLDPDIGAILSTGALTREEFQTVLTVTPSKSSMKQNISVLKDYAMKRALLIETETIQNKIIGSENPRDDIMEFGAKIKDISNIKAGGELLDTKDTVRKTLQMFKDGATSKSDIRVMFHTDFMDKYIMAFRKEVVVIAGNSGMGKTSLGLTCVLPQILAGEHVVYFCNESDEKKLMAKLFSQYVGRSFTDLLLKLDTLTTDELQRLKEISDLVISHSDNFHLYGAGSFEHSVSGITMKSQDIAEQYGKIGMLYVDYLQDMRQPSCHIGNETESIAYNIQGIKDLIQDLGCACVVFAQINRDAKNQSQGKPVMENLKGSSKIENIASVILFIHRQKSPDDYTKEILPTLMYTPKTRDQQNIELTIGFRGKCTKFERYIQPVYHEYGVKDDPVKIGA